MSQKYLQLPRRNLFHKLQELDINIKYDFNKIRQLDPTSFVVYFVSYPKYFTVKE